MAILGLGAGLERGLRSDIDDGQDMNRCFIFVLWSLFCLLTTVEYPSGKLWLAGWTMIRRRAFTLSLFHLSSH